MVYNYVVPMTTFDNYPYYNIDVAKASNEYIIDKNGKKYLDLRSGLWNVSLGYHAELLAKIQQKMNMLLADGLFYLDIHSYHHSIYQEFADNLLEFSNRDHPAFNKVFYTSSGSEGTELALKLSHFNNRKKYILAFQEGYHGTFFGGMAVSGVDYNISEAYNNVNEHVIFFPAPRNQSMLDELLAFIDQNKDTIAAFIFEPVIGSSGTIAVHDTYLNILMENCEVNHILKIFDEVATGFFRTGDRFYYHKLSSPPDILILSKSINNGILPFGAVLIGEKVCDLLLNKHIDHFSTQNGNLLSIHTANETLNYMRETEVELKRNVAEIEKCMQRVCDHYSIRYSGAGAMFSISINDVNLTNRIVNELKEFGILVYYYYDYSDNTVNSGITLFPPLFLAANKLEAALHIICKKIKRYM
ncbi:aminotransferase class III-fold pyridoxal phosphate-dependent enzyme [Paenibacillus sp. MER TA 81-3]|uniref:aminotransferase class III-fold pyridoxal phosphate-dependent enzyme n=1 Tax=Paenibacillus sp. MER TA 81-3 TaxID=2939573 RepID=UPI00203D7838|nr:aminotransferase class III-fold pyridoxal phosphate-dependent enzyme [Paenibacillus sp. MER TA 81-3]MCM3339242.1 aminotransferase class III-fold pyridoxal phosphate-dependent enzyme [Paenibacillus sp. MER TA 81-3]